MPKKSDGAEISIEAVLAFLRANPEFLTEHGFIKPKPSNADTGNIVDLTPAIARRARKEAQELNETNRSILHLAAENVVSWQRLHHATLALLAGADIPSLCEVVTQDFPAIFDAEECHLIANRADYVLSNDGLTLASGDDIAAILDGKTMYLGPPNEAISTLLGKPIPSIAIIGLPDRLMPPVSNCLLILAGKDEHSFTPDLAGDLLILLAEMVGVALAARLEAISIQDPA